MSARLNTCAIVAHVVSVRGFAACEDGVEWLAANPALTARQLWQQCHRPDWMLWLLGRLAIDRRYLVAAAIGCARRGQDDDLTGQAKATLDVASRWTQGIATLDEVKESGLSAYAAAWVSNSPASDALFAADSVCDAVLASDGGCLAHICEVADCDRVPAESLPIMREQMANIVRRVIPWPMVCDALRRVRP